MSLATRCSACGTMFRVVQDQLRVSEGWVRCGRCNSVFNALDALVDLEAEAASAQVVGSAAGPSAASTDPTQVEVYGEDHDEGRAGADAGWGTDPDPAVQEQSTTPMPLPEVAWNQTSNPTPAVASNAMPAIAGRADPGVATATPALPSGRQVFGREAVVTPHDTAPSTLGESLTQAPSFVRRAERDARWNSPAMRAALLGSALMLLALLALQASYHFRDTLAASSPTASRWLHGACARWDCRIEAPRRIREVTLEGSGLSRIARQPQAVKLSINLRNRGSTDLALPWVDLSLTDAEGKLIARRALSPADFRIDPPLIARGAELPLELVLGSGERAISGYTVELFFP